MKIYGQTLPEIFKKLPWQYKIVVAVGSAFILFIFVHFATLAIGFSVEEEGEEIIALQQIPASITSILDPSIAVDTSGRNVVMAYTTREGDYRNVRLATSNNKCNRWKYNDVGFRGRPDDLLAEDAQTVFRKGFWRIETPGIVYDPDDIGKEWKLYAYKYFWADDNLENAVAIAKHYGIIVYKHSANPERGWSREKWLFSPGENFPPAPYDNMVSFSLNHLSAELADVTSYSRPSVVYKDGYLLMSLSAFTNDTTPNRIILIASKDHGKNWVYLGSPLSTSDTRLVGEYTKLAGANLIEQEGRIYLAAVMGRDERIAMGTFMFPFENLGKAQLMRDPKSNAPLLAGQLMRDNENQTGAFGGGFAAYNDVCAGEGMFISEQLGDALQFVVKKTNKKPVED